VDYFANFKNIFMEIINGQEIAARLLSQIKERVNQISTQPILAIIMVGDDEGSQVYVERKVRVAEQVGIKVLVNKLPDNVILEEVVALIKKMSSRSDGIILQLPLPVGLQAKREQIINAIPIDQDVDCLRPETLQASAQGSINWTPPIAAAVFEVCQAKNYNLKNKKICLIGRGWVSGRPLAAIFQARGYDVDIVDSQCQDIARITIAADVIISATGTANLIKSTMVKEGALIIDAGFSRKQGKIVGDVDKDDFISRSVILCPSPGGIGPITIAGLLLNTITVQQNNQQK
jgi:methylenetetrahydrofolate dehydrogenase (NADP+)/methenyltetrahydrofolate cyclohydrolase